MAREFGSLMGPLQFAARKTIKRAFCYRNDPLATGRREHQGIPLLGRDARCQMPDARCQMVKRSLGENFRHQMTPLTGWHTPALPMQEPNRLIARSAPDSSQKRQRFRQQPTKCAKL